MKSIKSKLLYSIIFSVLLCAAGMAFSYAADIYPQRIISLGPCTTEELYLLGAGDRVVGVTSYCRKPAGACKKEQVGAVVEVNLEKIISLKPDMVIATSLTDARAVEKLKRLGIRVIVFQQAKDFAEICRQFFDLGEIVGKKREAEAIVFTAQKEMDRVKEKTDKLARPTVFVQVGAKPLVTAGTGSFINSLIESAGGVNVAGDLNGLAYMSYSREKALEADPDHIIIVTMGLSGEKEKCGWEAFKNLKAVKNRNIHIIDSDKFCSLTPVTFVEALEEMAALLHPGIRLE